MTSFTKTIAFALSAVAVAGAALVSGSPASAKGKEFFVQDYQFSKPMHGYSGHSGNYYCDYQRLPQRKCVSTGNGTEKCTIVGWTLREMCQ